MVPLGPLGHPSMGYEEEGCQPKELVRISPSLSSRVPHCDGGLTHCDGGLTGGRLHRQKTDGLLQRTLSATRAGRNRDVTTVRMCVCTHVQIHTNPVGPGLSLLAAFMLIVGSS